MAAEAQATPPRERNMASDKLGVLMRNRLLALLREHGEEEVRG